MADNMFSELSRIIEQVGKDKGIDKQIVIDAVIQGMLVAARKKWGTYRDIEAQYNEESGEVELYEFKEVVKDEDFVDEEVELKLSDALELDPDAQIGDSMGNKLDSSDLGRIAAQTAKQIITQKVRDAERDIIFNEFEQRKGEIASGIARRVERGAIVVDLGRTEAYIPPREQIPGEQYKPGDRLQGYIADVRQTTRGPQIIMSRADERYLMKLFEMEVPEIYDGIVQIMAAAREPGQRAKIAVQSKDPSVDPVGACVGMKGSRVQNIVQELRGEKIDIVNWEEDSTKFVCNALAPAEISKVFVDEANKTMEVVVPDHQLSLAIGRKGQNVRLAAKLSGWKLDIVSESSSSQRTAEAIFNLMLLPGMTETLAQSIYQSGFNSIQALAEADFEDITNIPGYETEEKAQKLISDASELIEKYKAEGKELPTITKAAPGGEVVASGLSAKSQAEERLKEELEQLKTQEMSAETQEKKTEEEIATKTD
ncbi:MAG: transcription termination/antitermination protein NusA [Bdellovibrionales bacterium RBG_16_40_8]|nr:MAG: transcription termination/antitermination protein NusA [Bdellovibrionales bacterium RBG_16_40_8]